MIQIPNPCSKNWNQLSGDEKQRFCESCGKNVFNFDVKSEESIDLINSKKNVCIKISHRNLNSLNRQSKTFSRLTLFTSLLFSSFLFGQQDLIQVNGFILDKKGFPVMDIVVNIEKTDIYFYTDENGEFSGKIPSNLDHFKFIVGELEYSEEFIFPKEKLSEKLKLIYKNENQVILGEIEYKPTFKQRVINTITWPYRKIKDAFFKNE